MSELFQLNPRNSFVELQKVKTHHGTFQDVGFVLQNQERYIANNGVVAQKMAQYINVLVKDNQNMSLMIESMMNANNEQARVLQQHQFGQQVLAEEIKKMAFQQQQPQQPQAVPKVPI